MTVVAPIPAVKSGADAFMEGASTAQGIFESMAKARQANQQTAQNQALFPYTKTLTEANAQQASGRAAQANAMAQLIQHAGGLQSGGANPVTAQSIGRVIKDSSSCHYD